MYRVAVRSNANRLAGQAGAFPMRLAENIRKELDRQNRLTIIHIARTRLSYPRNSRPGLEGLRVITGTLRRGLHAGLVPAYVHSTGRIVGGISNRVRYALTHEFGFSGTVAVRSHLRRVKSKDQYAKLFVGGTLRRVRTVTGLTVVKAHRRHMEIPARRPVGKGLDERRAQYESSLAAVVQRTFREMH